MLYDDHSPAHFHAQYGEYIISVEIQSGIISGTFPKRALNAVLEWYDLHKDDLVREWELARIHQPLFPIQPLE